MCTPSGPGNVDRTLMQPTVLKFYSFCRCRRPLSMVDAHRTLPRFFKVATGSESSGDEPGILEDDRYINTGVFQRHDFLHELGFRLQPAPAAATPRSAMLSWLKPSDVPFALWPDASWVSSQSSRPRRLEPGCIGTDRSLERSVALHLGLRKETTFRSDGST